VKFPVTETLYGLFFEDINRSGDGGLYPEMIRNRTFEDSLIPGGCIAADDDHTAFLSEKGWRGEFNHGEGMDAWMVENQYPYTPIPAWYAENAELSLDEKDTLNVKRTAALKICFGEGGCAYNTGYIGVSVKKGEAYNFYMFAKACHNVKVKIRLASSCGCKVYAETEFMVHDQGYARYDAVLVASGDDNNARFEICADNAEVKLGFISLMPADTYNGHGLRKDLMEMLAGLSPKFMRFPGGCIVEGFNRESLLRFSNMIGPVWERPTNWNLWAYRTTNGLGYHEWLQMCEDLGMKKMWVFNCGLTCQGRKPTYFEGEELDNLIQEAVDAIEYATAPVGTKWGDMRAAAGHPEPFGMDYVEIGNENRGPEYFKRYEKAYKLLKAKYPQITFLANMHVEPEGLPVDIVDEHFYNTPEFFIERRNMYDNYDRKGPKIFVGEYAVTQGKPGPGTLYAAIGEAAYLLGVERNQDLVHLTAYAPLFENVNFYNWYPNLICFDNHRTYGIPTYHALALLGSNRGKNVVVTEDEAETVYKKTEGLPGMVSALPGMRIRNVTVNGKPAELGYRLMGNAEKQGDEIVSVEYRDPGSQGLGVPEIRSWMTFGKEPMDAYDTTMEIFVEKDLPVIIPIFTRKHPRDRVNDWLMRCCRKYEWTLDNGKSIVADPMNYCDDIRLCDDVDFELTEGWHTFRVNANQKTVEVSVDGKLVQTAQMPSYPEVFSSADTTDDEIILKFVNFKAEADCVAIDLDVDVESAYCAKILTGEPTAMNTIDALENVKPVVKAMEGAGRSFTFEAPAYSLCILRMKKK